MWQPDEVMIFYEVMCGRCIDDYTVIHKHKLADASTHEQHKHGHVRDIVCSWLNTKVCVEKC